MMGWVETWFHPERLGLPDLQTVDQMPAAAALMLAEAVLSVALGRKVYNLRQSISNVAAGMLTLVVLGEWAGGRVGAAAAARGCWRLAPAGRLSWQGAGRRLVTARKRGPAVLATASASCSWLPSSSCCLRPLPPWHQAAGLSSRPSCAGQLAHSPGPRLLVRRWQS